jgi:hypothetical protein
LHQVAPGGRRALKEIVIATDLEYYRMARMLAK